MQGSEPSERQEANEDEANEDEAREEAKVLRMLELLFLTTIS